MAPYAFLGWIIAPIAIYICLSGVFIEFSGASGYAVASFANFEAISIWLAAFAVLILSSFIASSHFAIPKRASMPSTVSLEMLFFLCLAGYMVWFVPLLLSNPEVFISAMKAEYGAVYAFRGLAPNISGVTTLTQFGVAYCLLYCDLRFRSGVALPTRYTVFVAVICGLALVRAVVNSERLAIIEVVLPSLIVFFASRASLATAKLRFVRQAFPFMVISAIPVVFLIFEYNRSWIHHYQYRYDSFIDFGLERVSIYYGSAFNNMAGYLSKVDWPSYSGSNTMGWVRKLPVIGSLLGETQASSTLSFDVFLELYASEEFNNSTGIFPAYLDWGIIGGLVYFIFIGSLYGYSFLCFVYQRGWMRHFYPLFLFALFEILRIDFIVDGRSVAAMIGLLAARFLDQPVSPLRRSAGH